MNLTIPDFKNVDVGLIVALAGQRHAIVLRHGHHHLAAVKHHAVIRTKSDFLGVNATKYGGSHILKKTLLTLIDAGQDMILCRAYQAKFVGDEALQRGRVPGSDRFIELVNNMAHRNISSVWLNGGSCQGDSGSISC